MPRKKGTGEGTLKIKTINGRRVWWARWVVWSEDGKSKRPEKILGAVSDIPSKRQARELLNEEIRGTTGIVKPLLSEPTFREVWNRYFTLKTPMWSVPNRKTLGSVFKHAVLPVIGDRALKALTREPLQACLNYMTEMPVGKGGTRRGYSKSAIQKAQRNMHAMFEFAIDENLIERNPARKLELPRAIPKSCERFFTLDEVRRFLAVAEGRERIILRLFIVCGLRPGEVFALRKNDVQPGQLRIDEAIHDLERGAARVGTTKNEESDSLVALPGDLEKDLRAWAVALPDGALLFPTEKGTTWRIGNYLKRVLKPLGASLDPPIMGVTHQAMRRTCATHFQKHGNVKDVQAQMRHASPETTLGIYQKELPESVKAAVESMNDSMTKGKETVQ